MSDLATGLGLAMPSGVDGNGGGTVSHWILALGFWDNTGVWDNSAVWIN